MNLVKGIVIAVAAAAALPAQSANPLAATRDVDVCDSVAVFRAGTRRTPARARPLRDARRPARLGEGPGEVGLRRNGPGLLPRRHRRSDGRITNRQLAGQVDVLNNTFAGGEGGADTGFTFKLAGITRTDNPAWFYAGPGGVDEHSMKSALRQGGADALNFYTSTAGPYLGWAYLPDIVTKPGQTDLDGVVINWETLPGVSTTWAGRYDQGETATHEVGRWLNLEHTFFGGCSNKGDFVDDTPAEKTPTDACPAGKDTCTAPGTDPIHNYMDYSYDSCYTQFTPGQSQRMRDAWLFYRAAG